MLKNAIYIFNYIEMVYITRYSLYDIVNMTSYFIYLFILFIY